MKKLKKIMKKIIKDKQLLAIFIFSILILIAGCFVLGVFKTLFIVAGLVIVGKIAKAIIYKKTGKKKKKKKKKKSKNKNLIVDIILIGILGCILLGIIFVLFIVFTAPKFDPDNLFSKESSTVYSNNGTVVAKLGYEIRESVDYNEIPEVLIDAIIATEDSRFFQHNGVDIPRFIKASIGQVLRRGNAGGASTITMQLSKNAYTSNISSGIKGIIRKFTDIYVSVFEIEKNYTKEQIFEYYVNIPFLGSNSFGIAEAANTYFGKDVSELNLSEAAIIAGLFQAPSAYDPYMHPEAAANRRATVLNLMLRHGYITKEEADAANSIDIESLLSTKQYSNPYQGYIDIVLEEIEEKTGENPYVTPMQIYTAMDVEKQDYLNEVIDGGLFTWATDYTQEGIAVTSVETGAVLALSAGRNVTSARGYNRAVHTRLQPGSTAKPIFDYGPGVENLNWSTYTPFIDEQWAYTNGLGIKNWDGGYKGFLTLRQALGLSRNVPALKAFQTVAKNTSNKTIYDFATSIGVSTETTENDKWLHEAHALGSFNGTSPLEMAAAYAAFGNGGYYIKPYTVTKIEYLETGEEKEFSIVKTKVMEPATAYIITNSLMWSVNSGLASGERIYGIQVAAKTGTTNFDEQTIRAYGLAYNATKDYWAIGYTPELSVGLWYGTDSLLKGSNLPADNGRKDKLWNLVMKGMSKDIKKKNFTIPSDIVAVDIETGTIPGMLPSEYTPKDKISTEYYKRGTEPTEVSPRYIPLDNVTNITSSVNGNNATIKWDPVNIPAYYTENWMNNHITDDYGDFKENYIKYRLKEIEALGAFGYDIYVSDAGSERYITTTTDTSYTLDISNYSDNVTIIIKTCWYNDKATISSGESYTINLNPDPIPPTPPVEDNSTNSNSNEHLIEVNLKGLSTVNLSIGDTYTENGIVVFDNYSNVTSNATITTNIIDKKNNIVENITTSEKNNFTITYIVTYNGKSYSIKRQVIVK